MRVGILVSVATAIVIGALATGGSPTTANLWVDDNGGTCTRNATAAAYVDAAACTLAAADTAAQASDNVKVRCASGSSCSINGDTWTNTNTVTVQESSGYTVTVGSFNGSSNPDSTNSLIVTGSNTTFKDLTINYFEIQSGNAVTFDGITGQTFYVRGGDNTTVKNGDFSYQMNCGGAQSGTRDQPTLDYNNESGVTGTIIRNNIFHDESFTNCSGVPDNPHMDCFQISSTNGVTFEQNELLDCPSAGIIVGDGVTVELNNITIQNNVFAPANVSDQEININGGPGTCTNTVIRYNTVDASDGTPSNWALTNDEGCAVMYGNIFPYLDATICSNWGPSDHHNTAFNGTADAACGTGSQVVTEASLQFVDAGAGQDYHIGSSSSARAKGDPSNCPSDDMDGETRPNPGGTTCDAGADERS